MGAEGSLGFSKVNAAAAAAEATAALSYGGHHAAVTLAVTAGEITDQAVVQAVILTTADGKTYALQHVQNVWKRTELGWNWDGLDGSGLAGKTITNLRYFIRDAEGNYAVYSYDLGVPVKLNPGTGAAATFKSATEIQVTGLPADIENPVAEVKTSVARGETATVIATGASVTGGGITTAQPAEGKTTEDGTEPQTYVITVTSDNYGDISLTAKYTEVAVEGDALDQIKAALAQEEEPGSTVEVELQVETMDPDNLDAEKQSDLDAIQNLLKREEPQPAPAPSGSPEKKLNKSMLLLDFNILKTVHHADASTTEGNVEDTGSAVMDIAVPFSSAWSQITLYRSHKGAVIALTNLTARPDSPRDGSFYLDRENRKLHIYTSKFSTYAMTYYEETVYTVSFNSNGGSAVQAMAVRAGDAVSSPTAPTRSGYTFNGWTLNGSAYDFSKAVDSDITLTASWTRSSSGNGGGSSYSGGGSTGGSTASGGGTTQPTGGNGSVIISTDGASAQTVFTDVASGAYYYDAVNWAVTRNITDGTGDSTFSPDAQCSRAQMITFLWRAAGSPLPRSAENPFVDISESDYYYNAVLWAVEAGITDGMDALHFEPGDTVTRAQSVTFLYRLAGAGRSGTTSAFADLDMSGYYVDAVYWAVENGITDGTAEGTFSPDDACLRAQIVTFLYRYYV